MTSGSGTLASRARNTRSYGYHALAAVFSHGTFFAGQIIGINIIVEVLRTRSVKLGITAFLVYAASSTVGSLLAQWAAIQIFERNRTCYHPGIETE